MMKKSFESVLNKFNSPLWGFHCMLPEEVSEFFLGKDIKRLVCQINGEHEFSCALMPKGDGLYFININKEIRTKFHLQIGDKVQLELWPDESKYGLPMPEEMEVLLQQDPEADKLFHALTPGKQRSLLFMIGKPKTSTIRLNKALAITEYLKGAGGKVDFKDMNAFIRSFRKY